MKKNVVRLDELRPMPIFLVGMGVHLRMIEGCLDACMERQS